MLAFGKDDGITTAVLHNLVGENHVFHLVGCRCLGGDDLEVVSGLRVKVAVLHEIAIQGGLHHLRSVLVGFQAQHHAVLLREEQVEHAVFILGCHDDFDEELVDLLSSFEVDGAVAHQHATEGRHWVTRQSSEIGFFHGRATSNTAGVVVLKDGKGGLVEFTDEVKARVKVKQVVVRQLFAVQFLEQCIQVAIEGAFLVRVLAIAQGGAFLFGDAQRFSVVIFHKPIHDGAVVVRAHAKGVGRKTTAVVDRGLTLLVFEQLDEFSVVFL